MDERTLTALRGSIEKWEEIVAGKREDGGTTDCPLCALFVDGGCRGCPVMEKSGDSDCRETPYVRWAYHFRSGDIFGHSRMRAENEETRRLAEAELNFLRSLLPDPEQTEALAEASAEARRSDGVVDVSGCDRTPEGDYVLTRFEADVEADYVDVVRGRRVWSIGRELATGRVLASVTGKFYENPKFKCLWLR